MFDFSAHNILFDPAEALGINPHQWIPGLKGPGEVLGMQGISGSVPTTPQQVGYDPDLRGAVARGQLSPEGQSMIPQVLRGRSNF